MALFPKLRKRLHHYFLKKKLADLTMDNSIVNYYNARSIGVLYDATQPEDRQLVKKYIVRLKEQGKQVDSLAYLNLKKLVEDFTEEHFTPKQVDWLYRPDNATQAFAEKPYDLLINLCTRRNLPMEYLAATSKARYRVGRYIEDKTYCYDLMVYLSEEKALSNLIREVDHLLTEINKHTNAKAV